MSEEKKQKIKEHQKKYDEAKKSKHNNLNICRVLCLLL